MLVRLEQSCKVKYTLVQHDVLQSFLGKLHVYIISEASPWPIRCLIEDFADTKIHETHSGQGTGKGTARQAP